MRRRIAANRKAIAVLLTWVNAETKRVYKDRRDTSGAIFEEYAALYTTHTSCDLVEILGGQDFVDRITAKANRLQKVRPFQGHIIPALMKAVDLDMAYNSNAIEGNPIILRETAVSCFRMRHSLSHDRPPLGACNTFQSCRTDSSVNFYIRDRTPQSTRWSVSIHFCHCWSTLYDCFRLTKGSVTLLTEYTPLLLTQTAVISSLGTIDSRIHEDS
jgi:hypothetical protein